MVMSLLLLGAAALAQSAEVIVNTPLGSVSGTDEGNFLAFKGMRFAEPPERFAVAKPKQPWNGTVSAQEFGAPCYFDHGAQSEDCLYLNVWAPPNAVNLPVVVFIHGGGFLFGAGSDAMYWGDRFVQDAEHPVVYMTMNYRMGILGFYSDSENGANFGLQDQQESLRWVRDNIASFGGDPGRVTIMGQSAGAMSVQVHLVAPGSRGLFHRAFLASTVGLHYRSLSENAAFVKSSAESMGCFGLFRDQLKCMRTRPASVLAAAAVGTGFLFHLHSSCEGCDNMLPWLPVVDGVTLPRAPIDMLSDGSHAQVPVIVSSVRNETLAFVPSILQGVSNIFVGYDAAMGVVFRDNAHIVKKHYRAAQDGASMKLTSRLSLAITDALFTCYSRYVARQLAKTSPTYLSTFMHAPSAKSQVFSAGLDKLCVAGATCHASDVNWMFPESAAMKKANHAAEYTEEEDSLATTYSSAIKSFAYGDAVPWVQYSSDDDVSTLWGDSSYETTIGYHSDHCDFIESIGFATGYWGSNVPVVV